MFCFEGEPHSREITERFRKIRSGINDLKKNVLYYWQHGCIQPRNLSSALIINFKQILKTDCKQI